MMWYFSSWLCAFVDLKKCICCTSEVGCLWEFISLCFILWEFISPLVFLWGCVYLYFAAAYASNVLGVYFSLGVSCALFLKMFFWSNVEVCYFLSIWVLVLKQKKVWMYLSYVFCMAWDCFSKKFAKRGDCWVFEVLASLLLKQIFIHDVGYDVPTSWHSSMCPVCVPCLTRALSY